VKVIACRFGFNNKQTFLDGFWAGGFLSLAVAIFYSPLFVDEICNVVFSIQPHICLSAGAPQYVCLPCASVLKARDFGAVAYLRLSVSKLLWI
jgi:hypothetical protein